MPENKDMRDQDSPPLQNVIAIVYDFDGTLSPQPMQEYTVLPKLQIESERFWAEVAEEAEKTQSETMLVYMRLLLEKIEERKQHIDRDDFKAMASDIEYFKGVKTWFGRMNEFVAKASDGKVELRHYIISAGLKEILDGISIVDAFSNIFASEYHYDHHGIAVFPKQLITDTSKTQILFRINKGREGLREKINEHMALNQRPIPFSNMIYIGDGDTDVPSMAVVKQNGGHAVAVYDPDTEKKPDHRQNCIKLLKSNRIDYFAAADYSEGQSLDELIKLVLHYTMKKIEFNQILKQ